LVVGNFARNNVSNMVGRKKLQPMAYCFIVSLVPKINKALTLKK
jgi:uncharacterized protein YejL (UPF0352 family)